MGASKGEAMEDEPTANTPEADTAPWHPEIPVWALICGRVMMALFLGFCLSLITGIWSTLTQPGLSLGRVAAFAATAAAVRELLDAAAARLIMHARRTDDPEGIPLTIAAVICPAVAAATAATLLAPDALIPLTLMTWAFYVVVIITLDQPWDTSHRHTDMMERGRQVRLMTRTHFSEEIQEGRLNLSEIDDEGYYVDENGRRIKDGR